MKNVKEEELRKLIGTIDLNDLDQVLTISKKIISEGYFPICRFQISNPGLFFNIMSGMMYQSRLINGVKTENEVDLLYSEGDTFIVKFDKNCNNIGFITKNKEIIIALQSAVFLYKKLVNDDNFDSSYGFLPKETLESHKPQNYTIGTA